MKQRTRTYEEYEAILKGVVRSELAALKSTLEIIEVAVQWEEKSTRRAVELLETLDAQESSDPLWWAINDLERFNESMASTLRSAILLAAYAALESGLRSFCVMESKYKEVPLSGDESRRLGVDSARKFLKGAGRSFPDRSKRWQEIKHFVQLRHVFAHGNGRTTADQLGGAFGEYVKSRTGLVVRGEHRIELGRGYLEEIIGLLEEFFEKL